MKSFTYFALLTLTLCFTVLPKSLFAADSKEITGFHGEIVANEEFEVNYNDSLLQLRNTTEETFVNIISVEIEDEKEFEKDLLDLAKFIGISSYIRKVSKDIRKKAEIDKGIFLHGTSNFALCRNYNSIPCDDSTILDVITENLTFDNPVKEIKESLFVVEESKLKYWLITTYYVDNIAYVLIGFGESIPESSNSLASLQRNWIIRQ